MSEAIETGQDTPVPANEAQTPAATPENVATPQADTQAAEDVTTEVAKTVTMTQEEFDKTVQAEKAKAEARAERRALKAYSEKLERMTQQRQQPAPESAEANDRPPKIEHFDSVEKYVDAVTDWKLNQRDAAAQQTRQQEQARTISEKTEGIYAEAQKIQGFDREAFDELPLTRHIAEALVDSDTPAKLMAYMASNPSEVERISGLSPARQAAEMGKLEARLSAAPKPSSAPAPIKPIGTRGSATNTDLSRSSMDEYIAARSKQGASWARR